MTEGVPQAPALGDQLGGYVLEKVLHEGRAGTVYQARSEMGATVEVKLLDGTFAEDEVARGRLEREALAGVLAAHPNCVSVLDLKGLPDGRMFLVLEHVDGERLSELIARDGALAVDRALHIAKQVLAGLAHAHAADIVHRGIEPANVVVSQSDDGEVARLMNFGIAKLEGGAGAGQQELTRAGESLGNPRYSAPEVLSSGQASKSADLYSVAAMLFELLTGKLPFDHEDPVKALQAATSSPVPALSKVAPNRNIPKNVEELVRRGLSKTPDDRFESAEDMRAAIDAAVAGHSGDEGDDDEDGDTVVQSDGVSDGVVAAAMPASGNKTMALGSLEPMVKPGQRKPGAGTSGSKEASTADVPAATTPAPKADAPKAKTPKPKPTAPKAGTGPLAGVNTPPDPDAEPAAPSAPASAAPSAPAPAAPSGSAPAAPSAPAPAAPAQPMAWQGQQPMGWSPSRPPGFRAWFAQFQSSPKFPWIMLGIFVFLVAAFTALFQATD